MISTVRLEDMLSSRRDLRNLVQDIRRRASSDKEPQRRGLYFLQIPTSIGSKPKDDRRQSRACILNFSFAEAGGNRGPRVIECLARATECSRVEANFNAPRLHSVILVPHNGDVGH